MDPIPDSSSSSRSAGWRTKGETKFNDHHDDDSDDNDHHDDDSDKDVKDNFTSISKLQCRLVSLRGL